MSSPDIDRVLLYSFTDRLDGLFATDW